MMIGGKIMAGTIDTTAVTLNPGTPDVVLKGTIDAYGAAGVYNSSTYSAAVFGPADGKFHVHNRGVIESDGSLNTDAGILLGSAGNLVNSGEVLAGSGILVFGTSGIASNVVNEGKVHATLGTGVYLQGAGTVENSGEVKAIQFGLELNGGGYALNSGTVTGGAGIVLGEGSGNYVYNTGFIKATKRDGISVNGLGYVNNTGVIKAEHAGIVVGNGEVYNYGKVQATKVGVYLGSGSVYNNAGGKVSAGIFGVELGAAGYVYNAGDIIGGGDRKGSLGAGVYLKGGGYVYNAAGGRVTGLSGVVATAGALTLSNEGYIYGSGSPGDTIAAGVYAAAGGTIFNAGTIAGASNYDGVVAGIKISGAAGQVTNAGLMAGYFEDGAIVLNDGGTVVNTGTLHALGLSVGIYVKDGGSVNNAGYIDSVDAVVTTGGVQVTNTGLIRGLVASDDGGTLVNFGTIAAAEAVLVDGGGTVFDAGTITGDYIGVYFDPSFANELILKPGAEIYGGAYGGGGVLDLARGTTVGMIELNGKFSGFTTLDVDKQAEWELAAGSSLANTLGVDNDGTILALGEAGLTISGALFGKGTVDSGMGDLTLDGRVGQKENVALGGAGETLYVGAASAFSGTIENFQEGDAIVLTGVASSLVTGVSFSGGVLTVSESAASYTFTFANPGSFAHDKFSFFRDHGEAGITLSPRGQMSFVAPAAAASAAGTVQVPSVSYAPIASSVVPSSTGGSGGLIDSLLQQTLGALAPVVTLQG